MIPINRPRPPPCGKPCCKKPLKANQPIINRPRPAPPAANQPVSGFLMLKINSPRPRPQQQQPPPQQQQQPPPQQRQEPMPLLLQMIIEIYGPNPFYQGTVTEKQYEQYALDGTLPKRRSETPPPKRRYNRYNRYKQDDSGDEELEMVCFPDGLVGPVG